MLKKKINQEHVPMAVTENRHQSETENVLVSTTAIVETTNTKNKKNERANWSNRIVYLLSIIGFVVDLGKIFFSIINLNFFLIFLIGNVWRFPTTCYRNGGGAFLFPYFTFLFLVGLPCKLIISLNF